MAEFSFNISDITKLFASSGPALPEADAEMVQEADRAYAEGGDASASEKNMKKKEKKRAFAPGTAPRVEIPMR